MKIKRLLHPEMYQGIGKSRSYFEGWYIKQTGYDDQGNAETISLIPGVSLDDRGKGHSFVQVISSVTDKTWKIDYELEAFSFEDSVFDVSIGINRFSSEEVIVHIDRDGLQLSGSLTFTERKAYPVTLRSPGIMGWYAYVPFMECFHGVVSLYHYVSGSLHLQGKDYTFLKAPGYIEKDWGTSFPSNWIWAQSSGFSLPNISCMLSVATIPWLGRTFTGFLGFIWIQGTLHNFGTYTGARIEVFKQRANGVELVVIDKNCSYSFFISMGNGGFLAAPKQGGMSRTIEESLQGSIHVMCKDKQGNVFFTDTGHQAGVELSGDIASLI